MQTSDHVFIPFRCPDCKGSCSFETLKELRAHLQGEHSDIYAKSVRQHLVSDYPAKSSSPVLELFRADAIQIEESLRSFKQSELNNKRQREEGILMNSLSRRSSELPTEYQNRGRQRHRENKENRSTFRSHGHPSRIQYKYFQKQDRDSSRLSGNDSYDNVLDEDFIDDSNPQGPFKQRAGVQTEGVKERVRPRPKSIERIHNFQRPKVASWASSNENASYRRRLQSLGTELDSHVEETVSALSHEVVLGRSTQQATLDSLRTSQHIYSHVEQSAQDRILRQQEMIASLAIKLSEKEEQMSDILVDMNALKKQHDEEMEVKNVLNQKSTCERERLLQEEITHKQKELESLAERLNIARQAVMQYRGEIKEKKERSFKSNNDPAISSNNMDNNNIMITKSNTDFKNRPQVGGSKVNSNYDDPNFASETEIIENNNNITRHPTMPTLSSPNSIQTSREVTGKEAELVRMRSKSKQLENDRQNLLLEMQTLLETAATDNEKLRMELTNQGKQLSKLNLELERSKQEQSELLGETNTLYFQADLSLTRLKQMLEDKDGQLSTVTGQLEHAKDMQNKLIQEREEYLKLTEEKEIRYNSLVQENAVQLETMKDSLNDSQTEKTKLEAKMVELKMDLEKKEQHDSLMEERLREMELQLSSHEEWQKKMLDQINNKEERLHKAKISMEKMTTFLGDAADKELETRSKLEQFISTLVERSTQAEAELQKMKNAYALKVNAFADTTRNLNPSLPYDWTRKAAHDQYTSRQNSDDLFRNDVKNYDKDVERRERQVQNRELFSHTMQPRHQNHSTEERGKTFPNNKIDYKYQQEYAEKPRFLSKRISNADPVSANVTRDQSKRQVSCPPKRRAKGRPILIHGKEYPHASSYNTLTQGKSKTTGYDDDRKQMSKSVDNLQYDSRLISRQNSLSQSQSRLENFLLEKERHDFDLSPPRKSPPRKAHPASNHNYSSERTSLSRMNPASPTRDGERYKLFRNTPEINEMYKNVKKPSTSGLKGKQKRFPSSRNRRLSSEFIMDEDGIIWESLDLPSLLKKASSSQELTVEDENAIRDYQNSIYSLDMEQHSHEESEEDKRSPLRTKKSKQHRPSHNRSNLETPVPLGEQIVKVLNSFESSPLQSSARKQYSEKFPTRKGSLEPEKNSKKALQSTTSDSLESSPVHRAYSVQKRVDKLTSTPPSPNRVPSPQPAPRSKVQLTRLDGSTEDIITDNYNSPSRRGMTYDPSNESFPTNVTEFESDVSVTSYASIAVDESNKKSGVRANSVSWFDDEKGHSKSDDNLESNDNVLQENVENSFNKNEDEEDRSVSRSNMFSDKVDADRSTEVLSPSHLNQSYGEERRDSSEEEVTSSSPYMSQTSREEEPSFNQKQNSFEYNERPSSHSQLRQNSLKKQNSFSKPQSSNHYNLVMKELMQKHPYINHSEKQNEQEEEKLQDTINVYQNALPLSEQETHYNVEPVEENMSVIEQEINPDISHAPPFSHDSFESSRDHPEQNEESTDYGMLSSDEDATGIDAVDADGYNNRKTRHARSSVDASTDTDLEKMSRPGYMHRMNAMRRKKHRGGRRSDARKRRSNGQSDVTSWTSTDTNDVDDTDQDERWTKRQRRVALFCVLNYVDTQTLLNASQVCRDWRKICHHPALWKRVVFKNNSIGSEFLVTMSQWCTQTESLTLTGLTARPHRLMESEDEYQIAARGSLEIGLERLLFACQGSLQSLTIERCENILTDKCLWLISSNCRMLTHLCYRSAEHPPTPQLLWALGGGCPGVTSLMVHPVPGGMHSGAMNNRFLLLIGQFYRDLQEIGLGGKEFDIAGLVPMISSCQRLKVIHLDCCMTLTDDLATAMCRAGLKDLETLIITGTGVHAKAIETLQKNCRHLRKVSVSVTIEDFGLISSKRKERNTYKKSVQALTDLKKKAAFSNILAVEAENVS